MFEGGALKEDLRSSGKGRKLRCCMPLVINVCCRKLHFLICNHESKRANICKMLQTVQVVFAVVYMALSGICYYCSNYFCSHTVLDDKSNASRTLLGMHRAGPF